VTKVHVEVAKLSKEGYQFIMIGHKGHPEVEGTMGQLHEGIFLVEDAEDVATVPVTRPDKLAVVTQTTLSVDDAAEILAAVKARFPLVREPKKQDICYATQNRQDAVKVLAPAVDVVIVVGSPTSSNSNRLRELAERLGTPAYMVDSAEDLQPEWLAERPRVGLTAGASAPDVLVQAVIARLKELGSVSVRHMPGVKETTEFPLPKGLGTSPWPSSPPRDPEAGILSIPFEGLTPARASAYNFPNSRKNTPCSTSACCGATWTPSWPASRPARTPSPSWTSTASRRWKASASSCRSAPRSCRPSATACPSRSACSRARPPRARTPRPR
jgi:hypothetical protein